MQSIQPSIFCFLLANVAAPVQYIISYAGALQLIKSVETFHNSIPAQSIYYTDRKIYFFRRKKKVFSVQYLPTQF